MCFAKLIINNLQIKKIEKSKTVCAYQLAIITGGKVDIDGPYRFERQTHTQQEVVQSLLSKKAINLVPGYFSLSMIKCRHAQINLPRNCNTDVNSVNCTFYLIGGSQTSSKIVKELYKLFPLRNKEKWILKAYRISGTRDPGPHKWDLGPQNFQVGPGTPEVGR